MMEKFKRVQTDWYIFDNMNWVRLQSNLGSFEKCTHLHKDFENWLMIQFSLLKTLSFGITNEKLIAHFFGSRPSNVLLSQIITVIKTTSHCSKILTTKVSIYPLFNLPPALTLKWLNEENWYFAVSWAKKSTNSENVQLNSSYSYFLHAQNILKKIFFSFKKQSGFKEWEYVSYT